MHQRVSAPITSLDTATDEAETEVLSAITGTTENIFGFSSERLEYLEAQGCAKSLEPIVQLGIKEHWLIPIEHLKPDGVSSSVLGSGSFGVVLRARYHGAAVAVKAPLHNDSSRQREWLKPTAQELRVLRRLKHPHIVSFFGTVVGPQSSDLWLVMELVAGIGLQELVGPASKPGPKLAVRLQLAQEVCFALMYLHAQWPPVIHCDVKPSNVLVETLGEGVRAKLADFGLSRLMTWNADPPGGTRVWVAPEVLLGNTHPEPSSDVFSFGRLFYMTINGQLPKEHVSSSTVSEPDITANVVARVSSTHTLWWVYEACTCLDPKERPTMQRISDHLLSLGPRQSELPASIPSCQSFQESVCAARLACDQPMLAAI